jgi:peptidoglycan hydrolase-like protein with peptidoglycan-binding domain
MSETKTIDREAYRDWPKEGGIDAPQPWDLRGQGYDIGKDDESGAVTLTHRDTGEITRIEPGDPDSVSPLIVGHDRPNLAPGTAGGEVHELAQLLAELGYPNTISQGKNPSNVFDPSIESAVQRFREDYDVSEDPASYRGRAAQAAVTVGPYTWEALFRVQGRKRAADRENSDGRRWSIPKRAY